MNNDEYLNLWLEELETGSHPEGTIKSYKTDVTQFIKYLNQNNKSVTETIRQDVVGYLNSIKQYKISTKVHKQTVIQSFFSWMRQSHFIAENPIEKGISFGVETRKPRSLDNNDINLIYDFLKSRIGNFKTAKFNHERDLRMIQFMLGTGVRKAEVIGIKIKDMNFKTGIVKIVGKRSKERYVSFTGKKDQLLGIIERYVRKYKLTSEDYLFPNSKNEVIVFNSKINEFKKVPSNGKLSTRAVDWLFKEIEKNTGLDVNPHLTRSTYTTHAIEDGMDLLMVKNQLGHESLGTVQKYDARDESQLVKANREFAPNISF